MSFKLRIKQLREKNGSSQQDVADAIKVARATYANWESGKRDPGLGEINRLAEYYQISPADLISGEDSAVNEPITPYKFSDQNDVIPRDINPQVNPEKLREVLLYVLEKVGAKPNVGETVLYKLLYFIDFDYYEKYGQSITGLTYIRNHFGPTPAVTFAEIVQGMEQRDELEIVETKFFNNKQKKYLPNVKFELHKLSAKELEHINDELLRLADKTATELSDMSHKDTPWLASKQGEAIDYQLAMYRNDATSVKEYEDEL